MKFPLKTIHQIEITSRCNLRCVYCTNPTLLRPKVDMDRPTFEKALTLAKKFFDAGGDSELNLAGIGESTIHPDFVEYVNRARAVMGPDCKLVLATNGVELDEDQVRGIQRAAPQVYVSLHRPEKAGKAIELLRAYGLFSGSSSDPSLASIDWAGQVPTWHVSAPAMKCPWVKGGWGFVLADGRISTCCLDASGVGVIGTVDDPPTETQPYVLCKTCNQDLGIDGYDQQKGLRILP
jgi:hypothetical protein